MNITCEFKKMRDGLWYITKSNHHDLFSLIGNSRTGRTYFGSEHEIVRSPNGVYYITTTHPDEFKWDAGRLTFEII